MAFGMRPVTSVAKRVNLHISQMGTKCKPRTFARHPAYNRFNTMVEDTEPDFFTTSQPARTGKARAAAVDIKNLVIPLPR